MKFLKLPASIILILLLVAPLAIALWWGFALLAGLFVWLLYKCRKNATFQKWLKPFVLGFLALFAIWLFFIQRHAVAGRSYESNTSAFVIKRFARPSAQPSEAAQQAGREKRLLLDAFGRERLKIAEIATALDLYNSADAVFVSRNRAGKSDSTNINAALASLRTELAPHQQADKTQSPDLREPANLKNLIQQASSMLDKAQTEALDPELSSDQIIEKRNELPKLVSQYQVDSLYAQVTGLEDALRRALDVNFSPQSTYSFRYDRSNDTLWSEQKTIVNLAGQHPVSIDVGPSFTDVNDPSFKEQIAVREDSSPERELTPAQHQIPLHPETEVITITHRFSKSQASYHLIRNRSWLVFRGVRLSWPIPLNSSILLNLRFPEDPTINWPLTLTIRTAPTDALDAVYLPRHSFFYSDESLKPVLETGSGATEDVLSADQGTPKIADLAIDKTIQVELLPPYLSNLLGQKYKEYLVTENLIVSLLVAALSAACALILSE